LTKSDGIVLLSFFIIFLYYSFSIAKDASTTATEPSKMRYGLVKSIVMMVLGLIGLAAGGNITVNTAVKIAGILGVSQALIGLTIVAVGTSLPELATSVVAAYKKNTDIAIGNIVGSNIFNIFFILGVSAVITPLSFTPNMNIDILVVVFASSILFACMFTGGKRLIDRWEGVVFILLYISYITFLIKRG